jgi:putative SOS response-associated peptidase YedK
MCGRFTLKAGKKVKLKGFNISDFEDLIPRYNIAPSQDILTVVQRDSSRETMLMQWGLIPFWSKEPKGIINARVETIDEKASFAESFQRRRCLIVADGFYEWERHGKIAQPYYFQMENEEPFTFAGIWDQWRSADRLITSCAIITTTANALLAKIHNRMPVILGSELHDLWLDENSRTPDLKELLLPFAANQMKSHPVSYDVNDVKIDRADVLRPVTPNIGVTLSLFE